MTIRPEVLPWLGAGVGLGLAVGVGSAALGCSSARATWIGVLLALGVCLYMAFFFRDPDRTPPSEPGVAVAGADGSIAQIVEVHEGRFLREDTVRISIFLSLFDVHVNRAPIGGMATFLGYFPGRRLFTFQDKSSEVNQHNAILIEGEGTRCLVTQIVGPIARRVVYWPDHDRAVPLQRGARIGMMKFGSRLDMYFPKSNVKEICVREGDRVRAGETVVLRIQEGSRK